MKKQSKKALALLLAFGMAFSVAVTAAPATEDVQASGETNDEHDVYYEFENADLTQFGLTSTQYAKLTKDVIEGSENQPLTEHWFTGQTGYGSTTDSSTKRNDGLKPKDHNRTPESDRKYSVIPIAHNCRNFEMSVEVYASTGFGVAIGNAKEFPKGGASNGASVRFESGYMRINGTFETNSLKVTGTTFKYAWVPGSEGKDLQFNPRIAGLVTSQHNMYTNRQLETLHIRLADSKLTVWLDECDTELTMTMKDADDIDGTVSLFGEFHNGGGGFKSVRLRRYDVCYEFENADLTTSKLTSTQYAKDLLTHDVIEESVNKPLKDHWFTGQTGYKTFTKIKNDGLKPANDSHISPTRYSVIPLISGCKDFEMSVDLYVSSGFGVAIGNVNEFPRSGASNGASIRFDGGYMRINGTFETNSLKVTGTPYATNWVSGGNDLQYHPRSTSWGDNMYSNRQLETLNIKVEDGKLTIWLDGDDTVLTMTMKDAEDIDGTVSLFGEHYELGGGFKSVRLCRYAVKDDIFYKFDNAALSALTDWSAMTYDLDTESKVKAESLNDQWFTGEEGYPTAGWSGGWNGFKNAGLKPKHVGGDNFITMLTYEDPLENLENFESSFTYYQNSKAYGMFIGREGVYPSTIADDGVRIVVQAKNLHISGAIDSTSAVNTGSKAGAITRNPAEVILNLEAAGFAPDPASATKTVTVHVKVENGKVTASVDELPVELTVNLTGNFVNDKIALYATGCEHGGFKQIAINRLDATAQAESASVQYKTESMGEYAAVTLSTDTVYSEISGTLRYDSAKYAYVSAVYPIENAVTNKNQPVNDDKEGKVTIDVLANNNEKVVTLYFKTVDGSLASDFTGFTLAEDQTMAVVGGSEPSLKSAIALEKDYNADNKINVLDLVESKKLAAGESAADDSAAVRKMLVGKPENASPLIGKKALFVGDSIARGAGEAYQQGYAGRIAERGMLYTNAAVDAGTLTNAVSDGKQIVDQLSGSNYDFVVLQGGIKDIIAMQQGTVDETTIEAAMKNLITTAQEKYKTAKIIYVITSYSGSDVTEENMATYKQMVRDACAERGIEYVDLSAVTNNSLTPDEAYYMQVAPTIADAMEKMISK